MAFDLDSLKDKLDSETLEKLRSHVDEIDSRATAAEEKARKAQKESIDGRKGKDARIERMAELLGIEPDADLDSLQGVRGQAEAAKQFEQQVKRITRERDEAIKARDELQGRYSTERRQRAIADEVAKHPFVDAEDARALISARLQEEGDELFLTADGGKRVALADGVAWIAKTKPHLVRAAGDGSGGSGFKGQQGSPTKKADTAPTRKDYPSDIEFFRASAAFHAATPAT